MSDDDPVEILRALAHNHEPHDYEQGCCDWCNEPVAVSGKLRRPHADTCPWQRAVTFLASQEESSQLPPAPPHCTFCGKVFASESEVDEHYAESQKRFTHTY